MAQSSPFIISSARLATGDFRHYHWPKHKSPSKLDVSLAKFDWLAFSVSIRNINFPRSLY